jgi:hypothetical protein
MNIRTTPRLLILFSAAILLACQTTGPMYDARDQGWTHYGETGPVGGDPVAIGALEDREGRVVVEGTITEVCAMKGCWMKVSDGEQELYVRFKDYGFFVPRNAAGHKVVLHGTSKVETVSVADLRHFAEDAGKTPEQIAAITEPETRVTVYADSVYIEGEGLDAPYREGIG